MTGFNGLMRYASNSVCELLHCCGLIPPSGCGVAATMVYLHCCWLNQACLGPSGGDRLTLCLGELFLALLWLEVPCRNSLQW